MIPSLSPVRTGALFAALVLALVLIPQCACADFIAVSVGELAPSPDQTIPDAQDEPDEDAAARPEDIALLMLWMIIGDVPVAPLTKGNPSGHPSGNTPGGWTDFPSGGWPGDTPSGGGGDTPAQTPEPASWLLGLVGVSALALNRKRFTGVSVSPPA